MSLSTDGPLYLLDGGEMGGTKGTVAFRTDNNRQYDYGYEVSDYRVLGRGQVDLVFYNDAYIQVMGPKHPALGVTGPELWGELWPDIAPDIATGFNEGQTVYNTDKHLPMLRLGYLEETYFTFSMSPILVDEGTKKIGGVMAPSFEVTMRVIHERRERSLRELGSKAGKATSVQEACQVAAQCLSRATGDIPFSLLYLTEGDGERRKCVLRATTGIPQTHPLATPVIPVSIPSSETIWPVAEVVWTGRAIELNDLDDPTLPGGIWPDKPTEAVILPIHDVRREITGVLVLGVNPRRRLDDLYRNFHTLMVRQLSNNLTAARSYEEEKKKREALAELDRAKTAFFSSVSHEFRTPLTLILGPVEEALKKDTLPEVVREELGVVHRNALRLLKLVTSLLDFSRIEAGRMQASYRPTDLGGLITDLCGVFRSAMERAKIDFVVDVAPCDELVYVDVDMLEKIVYNLLSNALKCTFQGQISVVFRRVDQKVQLSVSDTGVGIPEKDIARIFERFYRVEGLSRRSNEGTGIGLALTQELARLHGGRITVQSKLGQGSTFTLTIPLGKSHLPREQVIEGHRNDGRGMAQLSSQFLGEVMGWFPKQEDDSNPQENDGSLPSTATDMKEPAGTLQKRESPVSMIPFTWSATGADVDGSAAPKPYILVCDDNADMAAYVRSILGPYWRVQIARDGQEALEACKRYPPGLIVSDVMMPRVDGFEL
ncbi:hypothetical protein HK104_009887, partial [Borealophlyctis nickersoniae]